MSSDSVSESMTELHIAGVTAAFTAAVAWASTGIFIRFLPEFSAAAIIAGRSAFALAGAGVIVLVRRKRIPASELFGSKPAWKLSLLMITYYILAVIAFQLAPVGEVATIISTSPLFALIYRRFRGMPISVAEGAGALIAMIGVALVASSGVESPGFTPSVAERLSGDGLALIGSAVMAGYSILYRNIDRSVRPSSRSVTFLTFLLGTVFLFAWLIVMGDARHTIGLLDRDHLLLLAGLGLGSTVLPTLCFSYASHTLSALLATSIRLLTPLLSAILAIILLREIPGGIFWPGTLLILFGLYLIMRRPGK